MDYEKLAQEFGLEVDEIEERIQDEGKTILALGWDSNRPGGAGANFIIEWKGYYFFTSSDMEPEGPYNNLEEVLDLEYFTMNGTSSPEISSDILPFERLEKIAHDIDSEHQQKIVINDKLYQWQGDSLRLEES